MLDRFTMPSKSEFVTFAPVTVAPIQTKMIMPDLMTKQVWTNQNTVQIGRAHV